MATGYNNVTDLYRLHDVVQNTMLRYPKDLIIASLKEFFSKDSYYHYVKDDWGFAKIVNHKDLPFNAGLHDDLASRIFIGEKNRFGPIYYPAIIVEGGGFRHVPISLNREKHRVDYKTIEYQDGYGNSKLIQVPDRYILAGAWEGTINVTIYGGSLRARDELVELCSIFFQDLRWDEFFKSGVSIKPNMSIGGPSEFLDKNDNIYKQTISVDIRTEWRREIPVTDVLEVISVCVEFGHLLHNDIIIAPNLTINTYVDLIDELTEL